MRNIILEIFQIMRSFEVIKRIDENSIHVYKCLEEQLELLLKKLFDDKKWKEKNNAFLEEEDFKIKDSFRVGKKDENDIYSNK